MFADDAVILSDSIEGLQSLLNYLDMFCIKWNLTVNIRDVRDKRHKHTNTDR